ncbi:MAG TPA: hypothetical protein VMF69_00620 [Gemmataceae bacterium]|nr:hypothetical protein [Gemmataceae bacterium]
MSIESVTPKAVFDLFALLSKEDKKEFLRLIGRCSTAEIPFLITSELPPSERERYSDMVNQQLISLIFPYLLRQARQLAREQPQLSDEEFDKMFDEQIKESMETYDQAIGELAIAKHKEQRDRKSDPEIVRRNMEICDKRKRDKKKWTLGRLARDYEMRRQTIVSILKDEEKWRRLAAQV